MATSSPFTTLREELALIVSLLELMKQEQALLISANAEGLDALTPQKAAAITRMAALASQRHQHLGAAGFAAQESGMDAWLASSKDATAASVWQQLLETTREAKELNRLNGMLINRQLTHTHATLNAMRGPGAEADAGVYGPSGQAAPTGPSRRFVVG